MSESGLWPRRLLRAALTARWNGVGLSLSSGCGRPRQSAPLVANASDSFFKYARSGTWQCPSTITTTSFVACRTAVFRPADASRFALNTSFRLENSPCNRRTMGTVSSVEAPSATITSNCSRGKSWVSSRRSVCSTERDSFRTGTMTRDGRHGEVLSAV